MRLGFLLLAAPLLLIHPVPAISDDTVSQHLRVSKPEIGTEATVASGEPLLVASEETVLEWARLKSDTLVSKSGMILPKDLLLECSLEHGTGPKECCKGYGAALYCLKDLDHDGKFDKVQIVAGGKAVEHLFAPYAVVLLPNPDHPRWKRELIFQGVAAGVLHLTYREYSADWSHPETSSDLVYDVAPSGPTDVTYKGAHIVFTSITGSQAQYQVAAGFAKN
ncbi:MAG TPA: hypothetical protein VGS07_08390 [Thermoanaerobaculia bacterium]|jgi:hypothetical protein|nr:hypothetical protein [Thermoanaerobaculia bacterium]